MSKFKAIFVSIILITGLGITTSSAAVMSMSTKLKVNAMGSNITMMAGAKTGTASGSFTIDTIKNTLCSKIMVTGLLNVTEAHIHTGITGKDGANVVNFDVTKLASKTPICQKVAPMLLKEIVANPAAFYLNVHTKVFPEGAVRGQLMKG